jgi:biopolymer transport protein ExbD
MIDVVFQLLIFFVLTAKFIEFEGELRADLPRRGGEPIQAPQPPAQVIIDLEWVEGPEEGRCEASTPDHRAAGGSVAPRRRFGTIVPGRDPGFEPNFRVEYPYPDFGAVREYLRARREQYSGIDYDLPVTIRFTPEVPVQMVVNVIDICAELGIRDVAVGAVEAAD